MAITIPFVPALLGWPGGEGWPVRIAFVAAFLLYFSVAGAVLLWALESAAFVADLARRPLIVGIPVAGLGVGAPVIVALIAVQRWMHVPRLWAAVGAMALWICACVLVKHIRSRRLADAPPQA